MRYQDVQTWLNGFKMIRRVELKKSYHHQLVVNDRRKLLLIEDRISTVRYPLLEDYVLTDSSCLTLIELFCSDKINQSEIPKNVKKEKYKTCVDADSLSLDQLFNSLSFIPCKFITLEPLTGDFKKYLKKTRLEYQGSDV
ncbi:hypothetical protein LCDVSa087R [Lymphocystis disease virus 3]|uniref:Uncharacterized protein n=1 Tax=Lymphocystis disease virus 3 TaxID=2560566 RepID=A0A1B2RW06_9VIRU|nr:hypothetical protein BZK12_gp087 [Lymphocystis disease virus Sa]AOC55171.1 hypothetical protein LCDVSa087R [Lymphocystis disease virus 3]